MKLTGFPSSSGTQLYYGNYRYHYRHCWARKSLTESLPQMSRIDEEERRSVRQRLASESGFTGLSVLHRLHYLYKFDILEDFVFDAMHTLLLGNIKRHLDHYKEHGFLSDPIVAARLSKIPWTTGLLIIYTHKYEIR